MFPKICGLTLALSEVHVSTSAPFDKEGTTTTIEATAISISRPMDELDVIFQRWSRKVIRYRALSGMGVEVVCQSQGGFPVSRSDAL